MEVSQESKFGPMESVPFSVSERLRDQMVLGNAVHNNVRSKDES